MSVPAGADSVPATPSPAAVDSAPPAARRRTRLAPCSATRNPPPPVLVTPVGLFRPVRGVAMVAPVTRRTRPLSPSATRKSVAPIEETLSGRPIAASVAGPPSPVAPAWPLPATVVTLVALPPQFGPATRSTRRPARSATSRLPSLTASTSAGVVPIEVAFTNPLIWPAALKTTSRWPPVLATTTSPAAVTVTPSGAVSVSAVRARPQVGVELAPPPANVVIVPFWSIRRMRLLAVSATSTSPSGRRARSRGWLSWASVAGPPSPLKPALPVPATVEIEAGAASATPPATANAAAAVRAMRVVSRSVMCGQPTPVVRTSV